MVCPTSRPTWNHFWNAQKQPLLDLLIQKNAHCTGRCPLDPRWGWCTQTPVRFLGHMCGSPEILLIGMKVLIITGKTAEETSQNWNHWAGSLHANHDVYVSKWLEALILVSILIRAEQPLLKHNNYFCGLPAMHQRQCSAYQTCQNTACIRESYNTTSWCMQYNVMTRTNIIRLPTSSSGATLALPLNANVHATLTCVFDHRSCDWSTFFNESGMCLLSLPFAVVIQTRQFSVQTHRYQWIVTTVARWPPWPGGHLSRFTCISKRERSLLEVPCALRRRACPYVCKRNQQGER